jgi:hypothetical protein
MLLTGRAEFVSGDRLRDRSIDEVIHHLDLIVPELRELDLNPVKVLAPGQGAIVDDGRNLQRTARAADIARAPASRLFSCLGIAHVWESRRILRSFDNYDSCY